MILLNALSKDKGKKTAELETLLGKMILCASCARNAIADGVPPATFANLEALQLPDAVRTLLEGGVPAAAQTAFNLPEDGAIFAQA